ncbi:response regulator [Rhodoferax sp.]|uniref:response regulator n=1 Tax=Rhodoferax sp. TaxID=50421 RepID=UPI00374D27DD
MDLRPDDLSTSQAMVIDSHATSRSILVAQLRDFGVGKVVQCLSTAHARRLLEQERFDVVLCEHHFDGSSSSGQDLVDDLRRNQLLPFSTVFIMVTAEATYTKVAEAAESALDGYLLKPHSANNLGERLYQARNRKISLRGIFEAVDNGDFETAANLCLKRFEARGPYWLYAARVGAELLLRTGQYDKAQTLYEAVIAAKTLPWAKLGVARSLLDAGQTAKATNAIENLLGENPKYADAYDILGRAQFELGKYDLAMSSYQMAVDMAPDSISRSQNLGLMMYYVGDRKQAEKVLDRTVRLGLDSKMLDCQTLVLLGFIRLEANDRKGLQRCYEDFKRVVERSNDLPRNQRLSNIMTTLLSIQDHQSAQAVQTVRELAKGAKSAEFDFESASNLLALVSVLAQGTIRLDEVESLIDTLGMRFCTTRPLSELLAGSAAGFPAYAERIRACHPQIAKITESAMSLSLRGDPKGAVQDLVAHGNATLNAKLIETAYLVLQRYEDKIEGHVGLMQTVQDLRTRFAPANARSVLGDPKRQAGQLMLRTGGAAARNLPGMKPPEPPEPRHAIMPTSPT